MAKYKKSAKAEPKKERSFAEKIMITFAILIVLSMVVSLFGSFANPSTDVPPPNVDENGMIIPVESEDTTSEEAPTPESSIPLDRFELVYLPESVLFES